MLEPHSTKATAVGENNNVGVWGRSPQPPETSDAAAKLPTLLRSDAEAILAIFFQKYAFQAYFGLNFSTAILNG